MKAWIRLLAALAFFVPLTACASGAKEKATAAAAQEMLPTEVLIIEQVAQGARRKSGGGSSSIGTDSYDVRTQTAWFYGARPIVTCFNQIESFGLDARQSAAALAQAVARWQRYFAAKKVVRGPRTAAAPDIDFKLQGRCKGEEDLVVFLGTGPIFAGLQDLKAVQRLDSPAAYVNKTYISRDMRWSKGYIRVVANGYYTSPDGEPFPDWRRAGALEAVLTHELGHVLGFTHTPDTIMRAELAGQVFGREPAPTAIDGPKQLVSCEDCPTSYRLQAGHNQAFFAGLGLGAGDKIMLLKSAKGFKLSDGKTERPLNETSRSESSRNQTLWSNFPEGLNDSSQSYTLYAFIAHNPSKVPLILEYNSSARDGAIILRSLAGGEIRETGRFILE